MKALSFADLSVGALFEHRGRRYRKIEPVTIAGPGPGGENKRFNAADMASISGSYQRVWLVQLPKRTKVRPAYRPKLDTTPYIETVKALKRRRRR